MQLILAADGTRVWSAAYDRGLVDLLQLQEEIARSVAAALEAELLGPVTAAHARQPVDPVAYDLYLRGRQRLRDNRLGDAERYLEQSLAIDPDFVPAYAALGEAYVRRIIDYDVPIGQYREKLRDLLDRGLEYAPDDAGLIGLSGQLARYDGDIGLAEQRFRQALERDPSNVTVQMVEDLAPQYATFRAVEQIAPERLSPAPYPVKSIYSSYPALYFPDYIRALRAAGDTGDAENMLNHLEGILQWRRARGLLVEERHVAEARARYAAITKAR